jgi:hypothetical protein
MNFDLCKVCRQERECVVSVNGEYEPFCYPHAKAELKRQGADLSGPPWNYIPDVAA